MTIATHGSLPLLLLKIPVDAKAEVWPIQMKFILAIDLTSYIWLPCCRKLLFALGFMTLQKQVCHEGHLCLLWQIMMLEGYLLDPFSQFIP